MATPTPNWEKAHVDATHYSISGRVFLNRDGWWNRNQKFIKTIFTTHEMNNYISRPIGEHINKEIKL